jgi:hypothetical protein
MWPTHLFYYIGSLLLLTGVGLSTKYLHVFQEYVSAVNKKSVLNFFEDTVESSFKSDISKDTRGKKAD